MIGKICTSSNTPVEFLRCYENMSSFRDGCKRIGLSDGDICPWTDFKNEHERPVVHNLAALKRFADDKEAAEKAAAKEKEAAEAGAVAKQQAIAAVASVAAAAIGAAADGDVAMAESAEPIAPLLLSSGLRVAGLLPRVSPAKLLSSAPRTTFMTPRIGQLCTNRSAHTPCPVYVLRVYLSDPICLHVCVQR
jgi:hypothetical protein